MNKASDRVSDLLDAGLLIRRDTLVLLLMKRLAVSGRLVADYGRIGEGLLLLSPGSNAMSDLSVAASIVRLIHHGLVVRQGKAGTTYEVKD
jgi:hypothetical protein